MAAIAPRARDRQNAQLPPPPPPSSSSVSVKAVGEGDRGHVVPPPHPLFHQQPPPKEKAPGKQPSTVWQCSGLLELFHRNKRGLQSMNNLNIHQCNNTECDLFAKSRVYMKEWLRVRMCNSNRTPQSSQKLLNRTKIKHSVVCLATTAYICLHSMRSTCCYF